MLREGFTIHAGANFLSAPNKEGRAPMFPNDSGKTRTWCLIAIASFCVFLSLEGIGQGQSGSQAQPSDPQTATKTQLEQMAARIAAQEARIEELEKRQSGGGSSSAPDAAPSADAGPRPAQPADANASVVSSPAPAPELPAPEPPPLAPQEHEHTVSLPGGGPQLKIRGFADFNLGFGSDANSLIFPLVPIGTTAHNTFEIGE